MKNTQEITTMEQVQGALTVGAVLQYGPLVFATDILETGGFQAKIFELDEFPEETGTNVEQCRISFQEKSQHSFSDGGRAIQWCLDRAKEYYLNT
ncbi:Nmad4 family putative nucleotide modification protein [Lacrimispora brassicae]